MRKSTTKLTPEQEEFWYSIRLRAGAPGFGQPYLSPALLQLIPVNAPGLQTMGIDRWWRVYIDFDYFMNEKGVVYAAGVLGHEPWHNLRSHSERFDLIGAEKNKDGELVDPNHRVWNIAGDMTINQDIPTIVPEDGVFPGKTPFERFQNHKTTEEYYSQLLQDMPSSRCAECEQAKKDARDARKKEQEQEQKDKQDSGDSSDKGEQKESSKNGDESDSGDSGDKADENGQPSNKGSESKDSHNHSSDEQGDGEGEGQGDGSSDSEGGQGEGSGEGQGEGSGEGQGGGTPSSNMPTTCPAHSGGNSPGQGEVTPNPMCGNGSEEMKDYELGSPEDSGVEGIDSNQGERIKVSVAQEVRNSPPGTLPGNMKMWADEIFEGEPLDWRRVLEGSLKQVVAWKRGQLDYRRERPHRRQYSREIIRPAMQSPKPRLGIAIDTSGSHLHKLPVVVSEIAAIVKQVGVRGNEILAFGVDVRATDPKPVRDPLKVLEDMEGGGGTDMRVGFEQLEQLGKKKKIDIGILISDLESGWPEQPPRGNIKYVVCGIIDGSSEWSMRYAKQAQDAMPWADVILIDFDEKRAN